MFLPCVILGPRSKDDIMPGENGQIAICTDNGNVYPIKELSRVATVFTGRPCFHRHGEEIHRLVGKNDRVGHMARAWWVAGSHEIHGLLRVTSPYWQPILRQPQQRRRYGLSIHIDADGREYEGLGLKVIDTIAIIYAVDLVENPAAGGRFLPMPGRREIIRRIQNVTV